MTQARSGQALILKLVSMRVPDAVAQPNSGGLGTLAGESPLEIATVQCRLLVHPGEPGEILVRLDNLTNRALFLDLQLTGSFPREWCQIGGTEGYELAPRQQMEAVLYFRVPADYFEAPDACKPGGTIPLDYTGQLSVFYTEGRETEALPAPGESRRGMFIAESFELQVRPRSLYLQHLPAFYQEVDFLGRYLKIIEQAFEPAAETLRSLWAYLDPLLAPEALLPFLGHWVAWPIDPRISLARQRRLIRHALELYQWHGTRRGLRLYIHLYTGLPMDDEIPLEANKHICIEELFIEGFVLGTTRLGQEARLGDGQPFHFIVRLRPEQAGQEIDEILVRHIIEQQKPAFCTYDLVIEEPMPNSSS